MKPNSKNPDVIVVGAGAAGLSAAKAMMDEGLEVVVLEAAAQVGGRCITDFSVFDTPFDRGGSWLHSAEINPLAELAKINNVQLHKKRWEWQRVVTGDHVLTDEEIADYSQYNRSMWELTAEVRGNEDDVAIEDVLPDSPWKNATRNWVAQMNGGDADVASAKDYANYADAEGDWLVAGGLGAFVKSLHVDVMVELNCPVSKIDYSGTKVRATTSKGTIEARDLIVTVSTGVLSAERIEFTPGLPDGKQTTIDQLPNGLLNKVGIEFDPSWKEVHEGFMADYHKHDEAFCTLLFGFYDGNLAVGFVAGRFADLLEKEGEGAATEFCREGLKNLFGNDVIKYVRKTSETHWRSNPNTLGSYSFAVPGGARAREVLAKPIDNKLFFAGEATMPHEFATVHGAYLSGKRAAREIIDKYS